MRSGNSSMLMISVNATIAHPQLGMYLCSHLRPWKSGSAIDSRQPKFTSPVSRGGRFFYVSQFLGIAIPLAAARRRGGGPAHKDTKPPAILLAPSNGGVGVS